MAQGDLPGTFSQFEQLQDANLGIARSMAEIQLRAANELQAELDAGTIVDAELRSVASAFVANARTLATVALAPPGAEIAAPGDSLTTLIRDNLELLSAARIHSHKEEDFDRAVAAYTVLQLHTGDLAMALQHGWTRYSGVVADAEASGLLARNHFDPATQTWTLGDPATAELEPEPPAPAQTLDVPAPLVPVAALSGNPVPRVGEPLQVVSPETAQSTPTPGQTPVVAEQEVQVAGLPSSGGEARPVDDVFEDLARDTQEGQWTISTNFAGITSMTSPNVVFETAPLIQSLTVECAPNGTLQYFVAAADEFQSFRVYTDASNFRTVVAEQNLVRADQAILLSDALKIAYETAVKLPPEEQRLSIRTGQDGSVLAQFSIDGYLKTRGKLLDACAVFQGAALAAILAGADEAKPPAEATAPRPANSGPANQAPIPAPRLDRPGL